MLAYVAPPSTRRSIPVTYDAPSRAQKGGHRSNLFGSAQAGDRRRIDKFSSRQLIINRQLTHRGIDDARRKGHDPATRQSPFRRQIAGESNDPRLRQDVRRVGLIDVNPDRGQSAEEIVIEGSLQLCHDRSFRNHEVTGHGGKAHRGRTRGDGGGKGAQDPGRPDEIDLVDGTSGRHMG